MIGIVIKSTGSWYKVKTAQKEIIDCRIKGKFRLDGIKHTNPIAVGDKVEYNIENGEETGIIQTILPRQNYIIRKSSNLSKQTHILASNIDQVLLVGSLVAPSTSLGFIDRFLVTAEAYHIPVIIILNKADLFNEDIQPLSDHYLKLYKDIGYNIFETSAKIGKNLDRLKELLTDKTTLISGHSGVGKSSLLNQISPGLNLKTGEISMSSLKGMHTTTFAEMFDLSFGGAIIDTPGIKEFGLVDLEDVELSHYFPEMRKFLTACRFNNCKHMNEPGCAVKDALEKGLIAEERYHSYTNILTKADLFE
ncbi:MAG: ribosome small subunit-dependent GTPase A [Bacteroidia bacterium]|jgi:ribosome biogenesis GTPase|nr:ribosome small subunit-dependent GTPase A [Bacteroidia bacterium]